MSGHYCLLSRPQEVLTLILWFHTAIHPSPPRPSTTNSSFDVSGGQYAPIVPGGGSSSQSHRLSISDAMGSGGMPSDEVWTGCVEMKSDHLPMGSVRSFPFFLLEASTPLRISRHTPSSCPLWPQWQGLGRLKRLGVEGRVDRYPRRQAPRGLPPQPTSCQQCVSVGFIKGDERSV